MGQKGIVPLMIVLILGILITLSFFIGSLFVNFIPLKRSSGITTNNTNDQGSTQKPVDLPTNTPTIKEVPDTGFVLLKGNYHIYAPGHDSLEELAVFSDLELNPQFSPISTYLDEESGVLYVASNNRVTSFDLSTKQIGLPFVIEKQGYGISYITMADTGYLYVTLAPISYSKVSEQYIYEVDVNSKETERVLGPFSPGIYSIAFYAFKTTKGDEIIRTGGGDGCAGWGTIEMLADGEAETILELGEGCNYDPRFVTLIPEVDKVVLMSVIEDTYDDFQAAKMDKLYTKEIYTGEEEILADLSGYSENVNYYDTHIPGNIFVYTDDELIILDNMNGKVQGIYPNTRYDFNVRDYYNGKGYGLEYPKDKTLTLGVTDLDTMEVTEYSADLGFNKFSDYNILGFWNGKPVVGLLEQ